jgi:flagellar protein FliO/FliZ
MQSVELVGRLLISLVVVLLIVWFLGRRLRRGGRIKDTCLIDVLSRQQLTRTASVAVVRVGDKALVIGVTDTGVNVLGETDLEAAEAAARSTAPKPPTASHRRAQPTPPRTATGTVTAAAPGRAAFESGSASAARGPLAGSALSPQTWRQTIESLRDLTSR